MILTNKHERPDWQMKLSTSVSVHVFSHVFWPFSILECETRLCLDLACHSRTKQYGSSWNPLHCKGIGGSTRTPRSHQSSGCSGHVKPPPARKWSEHRSAGVNRPNCLVIQKLFWCDRFEESSGIRICFRQIEDMICLLFCCDVDPGQERSCFKCFVFRGCCLCGLGVLVTSQNKPEESVSQHFRITNSLAHTGSNFPFGQKNTTITTNGGCQIIHYTCGHYSCTLCFFP